MFGFEHYHFPLWWIFPVIMMLLCIFMMLRRRRGMGCCFYPKANYRPHDEGPVSAKDILDMRFASGEIDQDEYETKKRIICSPKTCEQADAR